MISLTALKKYIMPKIFQFIVHGAFRLAFGVLTINSGQIFNFSQEKVFYQMSCISNACDPDTRHALCVISVAVARVQCWKNHKGHCSTLETLKKIEQDRNEQS